MLCRTYQNAYGFLKKITNPERPIGDYTRARWRLPFDPPARRAVLRRRRQRDLSLWTPFHRLRAGRICPFICAASARQKDGGPKGRLRQVFPHVSITSCFPLHLGKYGQHEGQRQQERAHVSCGLAEQDAL